MRPPQRPWRITAATVAALPYEFLMKARFGLRSRVNTNQGLYDPYNPPDKTPAKPPVRHNRHTQHPADSMLESPMSPALRRRRIRWLQGICLSLWLSVTLTVIWFARAFDTQVLGWPLGFWLAAQGVLVFYVFLLGVYAWLMQRLEDPQDAPDTQLDTD